MDSLFDEWPTLILFTSPTQMASQEITTAKDTFACPPAYRFPYLLLGLFGGLVCGSTVSYSSRAAAEPLPQRIAPQQIAQVNNADLACYLNSTNGRQYDLRELCGGFTAAPSAESPVSGPVRSQEAVLQTGDVQVTLRWEGDADLDLSVEDPAGDEVSAFATEIASGGQLDVDANSGCFERTPAPVENIFWPAGSGVAGDYMVIVELFSGCTTEAPIDFSLDILTRGTVQNHTGTVSTEQSSARFPFSLAEMETPPVIEDTTGSLPAAPAQ